MWFELVKELRKLLSGLEEVGVDEDQVHSAPSRRGKGGRPHSFPTENFTPGELASLKDEILHDLCDHYFTGCSDCSFRDGPDNADFFEIVQELPIAARGCLMLLQHSKEYRNWVEACLCNLNTIPDGAGCVALRRIKSKKVSLSWAFLMVYMHLSFSLGDRGLTTPEGTRISRKEGHLAFCKAHDYSRTRWQSAVDDLETYINCSSNDERYRFIAPQHLHDIFRMRSQLISLTESALACCGQLDNWIAEAYSPLNLKSLSEFLAAKILPTFIEKGSKGATGKWWAEAAVILNAGMCALPPELQLDENPPDFDPEYLRNLGRKDAGEGEHMLSYMSIPRYEDGYLAELCLDYLRSKSQYHGRIIQPKEERE